MSALELITSAIILGTIVSAILLLKQSAKKFHLTDEQLKQIKERETAQTEKDKDEQ